MSKGRFERKKEKSKGGKVILIILAVLLVVVVAAGVAGIIYYNSILNKMNHVEVPKIEYTMPATEATEEIVEETTSLSDLLPTLPLSVITMSAISPTLPPTLWRATISTTIVWIAWRILSPRPSLVRM